MFECTLEQGELFKKIVAALSDLVSEGNFIVDNNQISFQGMDSSHVSLVALALNAEGFKPYRCDRDITLGINFSSLNKILKCMASKDQLNIRANDDADSVFFTFASPNDKRVSNFELKLMDIDAEQLGIPDTDYCTTIRMPSSEFQRICRDLAAIGDSVIISASKEGVKFSVNGDIGSGDMILKGRMTRKKPKQENEDENEENDNNNNNNNNNNNDNDNNEENDNDEKQINNNDNDNNSVKVKNEKETPGNEDDKNAATQDIDGDQPMNDNEENEDIDMNNNDNNDNNNDNKKEAKKEATKKKKKNNNKKKDEDNDQEMSEEEYEADADEDEKKQIVIELNESVTQTFALRYLNNFTKATGLSSQVTLSMGGEVPLMVEYKIDELGYIRYYLAPKIDDDE